jgi:hypothetical protein
MTERYICTVSDMDNLVQELRNGARSYLQWQTMLDEYSGPHQLLGNPFVYNMPSDLSRRTFIYNLLNEPNKWFKAPSYGLYGQFTKFLKRDMVRVDCTGGNREWITAAAFMGEDGKIVMVTVNQTDEDQSFILRIGGAETPVIQQAQSVTTYEIIPGNLVSAETCTVSECPQAVLPTPDDFCLEAVEIITSGKLKCGEEISFSCRIRNTGNLPSPQIATIRVQFLLDGDQHIARSTTCAPSLLSGGEAVVKCNVPYGKKITWTAEAGYHTIFAVVDVGNCFIRQRNDTIKCSTEIFIE